MVQEKIVNTKLCFVSSNDMCVPLFFESLQWEKNLCENINWGKWECL